MSDVVEPVWLVMLNPVKATPNSAYTCVPLSKVSGTMGICSRLPWYLSESSPPNMMEPVEASRSSR